MLKPLTNVISESDNFMVWTRTKLGEEISLASLRKLLKSGCAGMPYYVEQGRFNLEAHPGKTALVFSGNLSEAGGRLLPVPERSASMQSHTVF